MFIAIHRDCDYYLLYNTCRYQQLAVKFHLHLFWCVHLLGSCSVNLGDHPVTAPFSTPHLGLGELDWNIAIHCLYHIGVGFPRRLSLSFWLAVGTRSCGCVLGMDDSYRLHGQVSTDWRLCLDVCEYPLHLYQSSLAINSPGGGVWIVFLSGV